MDRVNGINERHDSQNGSAESNTGFNHIRKRIIICCDGTWQSSVSGERNVPSNVTRLVRHLARSEKQGNTLWQQIVWYDSGIGTGDLSKLDVNRQGATGAGLAINVIEAYSFIVSNYSLGDKIFCFGFSRGAYTARALVGLINDVGVCSPLDMQMFPVLYELYQANVPGNEKAKREYERFKTDWMAGNPIEITLGEKDSGGQVKFKSCDRQKIDDASRDVEVVGVWDTVGSLGVPDIPSFDLGFSRRDRASHEFHDVRLSDRTHHAFHALALDERRKPFTPTLWYVPFEQKRPRGSSFKQVWFPGVHINIGGGSDDMLEEKKSDFEQIANITFAWMVEQVRPHLAFDEDSFVAAIKEQQHTLEALHGEDRPWPKSWTGKLYAATGTVWSKIAGSGEQARVIAEPGWATGPIIDSYDEASRVVKSGGMQWRSPGETIVPKSATSDEVVRTNKLGLTDEWIHPCVFYRKEQLKNSSAPYEPPALRGWTRYECENRIEGWEWRKDGVKDLLKEYRVMPHSDDARAPRNLERLVAEAGKATEYLEELDKAYRGSV
ncbi:hypothetical protein W97_05586 [Coniosporium apollinis CBS 100218]|uniref:T6SS Phospholipase effector Tle1-like catalytic domain-containing protein n=1 Tax=Coniosporium apollinis (strain CBS 100218) TaxID=1168221 RepID=R7YWI0_CONA1|nr:uncharacterized protein W97_05586 [Coniosporium apollinis CBS 100218]EON66193.1 hypothetical protein W97_05586 [Coniosporium apollinis CBS 100218]